MKIVKIVAASLLVILLGLGYFYFFGTYSEGFRAGTIVKLSKKGVIFNTNEGQLNMGMYIDEAASSASNNLWEFSVEDNPALIKEMEDAMLSGHRVKLQYKEKFVKLFWRGDTKYIVVDVEIVK